ncbi:hypothetical protein [Streptomyces orinoci]|uniref:Secreted protein n=1 Tax=Streptomyces orinoci TaxID=67339 RepID=A0ABV3JWI6_STRON|nr:hypothetical protein [Streptomyces orinoci]
MQPPAGLPHTRTRPVHWLVTALTLAAVLTGAALLGPGDDTATASAPPAAAPDARTAHYPLNCGPAGLDVVHQAVADLDGDGRPETVAVVRCASGGGTPPSGVYVLSPAAGPGGAPRLTATLVDPAQKMSVTGFSVRQGLISATLLGYSAPSVPRCCPDLRRSVQWRWQDGKFALTAAPVAGSV